MKYVILIYSNPESRKMWESFSADEQAAGLAYYQSLTDDLAGSGELLASERLADPAETIRLPARDGAPNERPPRVEDVGIDHRGGRNLSCRVRIHAQEFTAGSRCGKDTATSGLPAFGVVS